MTRAGWELRPALRSEEFFVAVDAMRGAGKTGKAGMITPLAGALIAREFPDEFRLTIPPVVFKPATAALAFVGPPARLPRCGRHFNRIGSEMATTPWKADGSVCFNPQTRERRWS